MLDRVRDLLGQEVAEFAADAHNAEIQRMIERCVEGLKQPRPRQWPNSISKSRARCDFWSALVCIVDGDSQPRFYHENGPKKSEPEVKRKKNRKQKTTTYAHRPRKNVTSQYLIDNINHFGANGGFEFLFHSLSQNDLSIDEILLIIKFLHGCRIFLVPDIIAQINKHSCSFFEKFIHLKGQTLKDSQEDALKLGISQIYSLCAQISNTQKERVQLEHYRFEICCNFMSSPFLNKQVLGLNMLTDLLDQADQQKGILGADSLGMWINQKQLLRGLLQKPSLHSEIAQRTVSLVTFLLKHDKLRPNHVELIWKIACSGVHSSTSEHIEHMIKLVFDQWPPQKLRNLHILEDLSIHSIKTEHLDLIHYFAKSILQKEEQLSHQEPIAGVNWLWKCTYDEKIPPTTKRKAISLLSNLMQEPHGRRCRRFYLAECSNAINKGGSTYFVHALLSFLQTFSNRTTSSYMGRTTHSSRDDQDLTQVLEELNSNNLIFALVQQILDISRAENPNIDSISIRLNTLTFICTSPKFFLDLQQMMNILQLLLAPCSPPLQQVLINWLNSVANSLPRNKAGSILTPTVAKKFFAELSALEVHTIRMSAYRVFERFFLQINGACTHLSRFDSPETLVVQRVFSGGPGSPIVWHGFQQLWSVALQSQHFAVGRRAIFLIVQLHKQLVPSLSDQLMVRQNLVKACIDHCMGSERIQRRRALLLLREFIMAFRPTREVPKHVEDREISCNLQIKRHGSSQNQKMNIKVNTLMRVGELRSQLAVENRHKRQHIELYVNSFLAEDDGLRFCQFVKRNRTDPLEITATLQGQKWYAQKKNKRDKTSPASLLQQKREWYKKLYDILQEEDLVAAALAYDIISILQPPDALMKILSSNWSRLFMAKGQNEKQTQASSLQVLLLVDILADMLNPKKAVFLHTDRDIKLESVFDHYRTNGGFSHLYQAFMDELGWEKPNCPYAWLIRNRVILRIMKVLNLRIPNPDKPERHISLFKYVTPHSRREDTFMRLFDIICDCTRALPAAQHGVIQSTCKLNVLQTVHDTINEGFMMVANLLNIQPPLMTCFNDPHLDKQVDALITGSLLNGDNLYVQRAVKRGIQRICNQSKVDQNMPFHPSEYFRKKLIAALGRIQSFHSNGEYFDLMRNLFEKSSRYAETASLKQVHELIAQLTGLIKHHQPVDGKGDTLIGLLGLTRILVDVMNREIYHIDNTVQVELTHHLFTSCLFQNQKNVNLTDVWPVKCKSAESRDAAFELLESVAMKNPPSLERLLKLLDQFLTLETDQHWWRSDPARQMRAGRYVGLRNLGNTCYLNCIIQQLFCLSAFSNTVLQLTEKSDDLEKSCFYELQKVFQVLSSSHKKFHNPDHFVHKLNNGHAQPIDVSVQTDLHEFLMSIFTQLDERLKHTEKPKLVSELFEGKQVVELVTEQGHRTRRTQTFTHIQVHVKDISSLEEGLTALCKDEIIPDYRCSVTGESVSATQTSVFGDLPPVLIFCLSRFDYSVEHARSAKLNHRVSFPDELNMGAYRRPSSQFGGGEDDEYHLVGVVIHKGEPNRGHYYSFIKTDVQNDEWYRFDDETVSPFDGEKLAEEAFGGEDGRAFTSVSPLDKDRNAYLLFYVRKSMLSEMKPSNPQADRLAPYLAQNIKTFQMENMRLFRDANIIEPRFHRFCEHVLKENLTNNAHFQLLTSVCLRFVFNVVCKLNRTAKDLKPWFKLLKDIFSSPGNCKWLLEQLSQPTCAVWLAELLIVTRQTSVRAKVGEFLAEVCKTFIDSQHRGDPASGSTVLDDFLVTLLNCVGQWHTGEQVFDLMFRITKSHEQAKRTLLAAGCVRQLYGCLCKVSQTIYENNKQFPSRKCRGVDVNQIIVILDGMFRICNFHPARKDIRSPLLKTDPANAVILQRRDLELLDSPQFYSQLLSKDCKLEHIVSICSHLSFENQARFQIVLEIVLERLKWLDFDEFYLGLSVLLSMLRIKDGFQRARVPAVLGRVCAIMMEQQFYWKATDTALFCLLRASRKNDDIANWLAAHINDPSVRWIEAWLQKKMPKSDSDTQLMFKSQMSFSSNPDEQIDAKRKKGDNLNNWKRIEKMRNSKR